MMDYRSLERLEVYRQNERVGTLSRLRKGCEFRYEPAFLTSAELPIGLRLPKTPEPLVTEGILNLPTYFAGLLPEGVMFSAAQLLHRIGQGRPVRHTCRDRQGCDRRRGRTRARISKCAAESYSILRKPKRL